MKTPIYNVISVSPGDEGPRFHITLQGAHPVFAGHFPGNPILPGACLLQIVRELTEKETKLNLQFKSTEGIKFLKPITPEQPGLSVQLSIIISQEVKVRAEIFNRQELAFKMKSAYYIIPEINDNLS